MQASCTHIQYYLCILIVQSFFLSLFWRKKNSIQTHCDPKRDHCKVINQMSAKWKIKWNKKFGMWHCANGNYFDLLLYMVGSEHLIIELCSAAAAATTKNVPRHNFHDGGWWFLSMAFYCCCAHGPPFPPSSPFLQNSFFRFKHVKRCAGKKAAK